MFVVGSALCGIADSMYELAAFRALQGIGAGGLMSLALAIIGDIVPPRERSKYQGYFMAVWGTSSVLGPVIGGFLAGQSSILGIDGWRWIFWINVPLGIVAIAVVMRVLHLPHQRRDHRIDWPGALALVVALVPLLIVAEQGREWGWSSGRALLCYVVGAVGPGRLRAGRARLQATTRSCRCGCSQPDVRRQRRVAASCSAPACSAASCCCRSTCRWSTARARRSPACRCSPGARHHDRRDGLRP